MISEILRLWMQNHNWNGASLLGEPDCRAKDLLLTPLEALIDDALDDHRVGDPARIP
jgi:hypothetical protein